MSNTDFSDTVQAKSDQMNAIDFIAGPQTYKIKSAIKTNDPQQPISIMMEGQKQPYKPSLGYRRILVAIFGIDGKAWPGQSLTLDLDESVIYAGKEVGGICIKAMTGMPASKRFKLSTSRTKFKFVTIEPLTVAMYDQSMFDEKFPAVSGAVQNKQMTNAEAIAQLEKTAPLTDAQKTQVNSIQVSK